MGCFSAMFIFSVIDKLFVNWYENESSCLELLYCRLVRRKRTLIDIFEKRPDSTNSELQYDITSLFTGYEEAKSQLCDMLVTIGYPSKSARDIVKVLFHSSAFDEDDAEKLETLYQSYIKAKAIADSFDESMFSRSVDIENGNNSDTNHDLLHIECVSCSRTANAQLRACQIQFHKILSKYMMESPNTEDFLDYMIDSDRQVTELNITEKLHEVHKERLTGRLPAVDAKHIRSSSAAAAAPTPPPPPPKAATTARGTVLPAPKTTAKANRSTTYTKVPTTKRRVIEEFSI